jgi:hypothetical protein
MEFKLSKNRVWVFRILVAAAAGLMLVTWFLPWWNMDVEGFSYKALQIRPWGLVMSQKMTSFAILMKGAELPVWFPSFMWTYLALCMIALLVGMFVRGKEFRFGKLKFTLSHLLVGGVGLSYIVAGLVAAVYAGMRMQNSFGVALQGRTHIELGDPLTTYVNTSLQPGWYLIFVTGILFLVLAIFRDKITGEA